MANKGELYLGLETSESLMTAYGRTFTIKAERIAREGRAASGMLRMDIVATKKIFTLDYNLIDETDLNTFITLYNLNSVLSLLVYTTDVAYDQYDVIMSPIDRTRLLATTDGLWEGVSIELKEV